MRESKAKRVFKGILIFLIIAGVLAGTVALVSHFKKDDGYDVVKPKFVIGGLDENGMFVETKYSLYTEEAFYCEGLKITKDFKSTLNYQVFYYDDFDNYQGKTAVYTTSAMIRIPTGAVKARIVITPSGESKEQLGFFDRIKLPREIEIKITKRTEELKEGCIRTGLERFPIAAVTPAALEFTNGYGWGDGKFEAREDRVASVARPLVVSEGDTLNFTFTSETYSDVSYALIFFDSDGGLMYSDAYTSVRDTFTVPEGASYVHIVVKCGPLTAEELARLPYTIGLVKAS